MILAAGLGTRLRPLTNHRPKALVEVAGRTLLEITLARLHTFGVSEVIVNVHHFADQVADYLRVHNNFGMRIEVSREEELLDTGGGLKKAAWFFLEDSATRAALKEEAPFILHNVDVLSNLDLGRIVAAHVATRALATLAVQDRSTSRYLLFDEHHQLCGRSSTRELNLPDRRPELVRPCPNPVSLAFCGIHVISPRLLPMLTQDGAFSIITSYLRLASQGEDISAFPADRYYWRDLGRPENISQAERDIQNKVVGS
jgi:NDP-sugar pyrophosphorylase family protein